MNAIFKVFLLAGFLMPLNLMAQSQPDFCATKDGKSNWLIQYQQNPGLFPTVEDTLYVPLTIHLVGTDNDAGYFNEKLLLEVICVLNEDFEESAIQFYIKGDINYIANSVYNEHTFGQGSDMMQEYKVENTINCYIVDDPAGACGYSSYNQGVALAEQCISPQDHTWAHELGHFLSLPHTFYGWEGFNHSYSQPAPVQIDNAIVERVDGTNCSIAGDGFCDTPPDYLNYRWTCPDDGFSITQQLDPDSIPFNSDGTFFMSYAGDNCMERFSDGQIAAMRANLMTEKQDYLDQDVPIGIASTEPFTVITPEDGAFIEDFYSISFEWEPLDNATNYIVEFSPFSNFTLVLFRYEVTEPGFSTTDIPANYQLYWRVRPYNAWHTCEQWTEPQIFSTGEYSSARNIEGLQALNISPVPLPFGESLMMEVDIDQQMEAQVEILDLSGKVLYLQNTLLSAGNNTLELSTNDLAPGLYMVRLHTEYGAVSRKLVIAR
ncbi:MAG: T9SS type A sorting domain-containing protein [Bacteroidetes bacterium]|nr:T9SS type A sorting domain-containing protein [Bacteroidota bacterium]